jgi:glutamate synthase domain-containing protein 3
MSTYAKVINAAGVHFRELNEKIRQAATNGIRKLILENVYGHRYIGTGVYNRQIEIEINGTPGQDLGAFLNGPISIQVYGNGQDGIGNTMNDGKIIIHGNAGDLLAMSMRGGKIFIRGDVGYRCLLHMKEYLEKIPVVVIGGTAQDFFGEYMAGGIGILLGLNLRKGQTHRANFIGTGMHGGTLFIRGDEDNIKESQLGKEISPVEMDDEDFKLLEKSIREFTWYFDGFDHQEILDAPFTKLIPVHKRPYGKLYAY